MIYWKDDGDAVYTFKRNGNWYLHGVGGKPFFQREGITWPLISARIQMRYLPEGYILDSGAPLGVLKPGVDRQELFFIQAWTLTEIATQLLKHVLNHTMNIQSKDMERLPYPSWVSEDKKKLAITQMQALIRRAQAGEIFDHRHPDLRQLDQLFALPEAD